jgi:hypothetical protein
VTVLDERSLAATVDAVEDARLRGRAIPKRAARDAARWIATRQGLPGAYRGLFAMTEDDWKHDLRLATGEKVTTRAGRAHILGEESARALLVLGVDTRAVRDALDAGWASMSPVLRQSAEYKAKHEGEPTGEFCCAACSVSVWRHMGAGGFPDLDPDRWLAEGMRTLARHRKGSGWGRYPFHYTLLALGELDAPGAVEEIRFVARRLERAVRGKPRGEAPWAERRRLVAERALARA